MNKPQINKQTLIQLLSDNSKTICKYGVKRLGVFGSFVNNQATENSDVDFFVEFFPEQKNFDNFMELAFFGDKIILMCWRKYSNLLH